MTSQSIPHADGIPALPKRKDIHHAKRRALAFPVPHLRARRWNLPAKVALLAAAGLIVGLGGGQTYALWSDSVALTGSASSGHLDLTDTGACNWARVTPGYTGVGAKYPNYQQPAGDECGLQITLPTATPGDVFEYGVAVTTDLLGDNLAAGFTLALSDTTTALVDSGLIAVGFYVSDASTLAKLAPPGAGVAAATDTLSVPGLVGNTDTNQKTWNVILQITVLGDYVWAPDFNTKSAGSVSIGTIDVQLVQLREPEAAAGAGGD